MYLMLKIIKIFFITSFNFLVLSELQSKPVGKGLSCFSKEDSDNNNYESFRGLYFESDNSIRVVSFKSKNKSLKIISKLTPFKISEKSVKFKIKFIWYGDISFEEFTLRRKDLELDHEKNNENKVLKCKILDGEFMPEMIELKNLFQSKFDDGLKSNKI